MMRWVILTLLMVGLGHALDPMFHPTAMVLDLSHLDSASAIIAGGETVPSRRWPKVMDLYDRGVPLQLALELPTVDEYWFRFKLAFQKPGLRTTVQINGISVAECVALKGGDAAEKFSYRVAAEHVRPGRNVLQFQHGLPARAVRYELVEARNYRSELLPGVAYLAFRHRQPLAAHWWRLLLWLVIGLGSVFWAFALGSWLLGWVYQTPRAQQARWWWIPVPLVAIGALAACGLAWLSPYRLVVPPWVGIGGMAGLIILQDVVIAVPGIIWRVTRGTVSVAAGLGPPVRVSVAIVSVFMGRALWLGLVGLGRLLVLAGRQWLPAAARGLWRWWLRHQSAPGYARLFVYLLGVAGGLWLLKAKAWAERVSEWAWCALLISCLWYAVKALRAGEDEA